MSVRKNAKFLSAAERDALVRAFVMMRADIVNPAATPANRYSRWEQYVAVHRMIQNANTPSTNNVNFGHGGNGAYGFFPWHRYFLHVLEQQLQTYVPGVTIPYWDWTDPSSALLIASFLGPNGDPSSSYEVRQGYFAKEAPGTGINATPAPAWWPAGLAGWTLHSTFGTYAGALRRQIGSAAGLPSITTLRSAMAKTTYPLFQNAVESGSGTSPFHQLHNGLHTWFGSPTSHMSSVVVSPFDPMFYLHHCNIDRLWAMWQMDGHATEYPLSGGNAEHHLNDPMYPWIGGLAGYSSNLSFAPITMPDFSALGVITPADVLDHRALGYSYDTQVVIGLALDRTGSMMGMTPDPMTTVAPDVTKWEAAKRGVSAFLQDCEAAYQSAEAYVVAGVKTFRRLVANDFAPVFAGTPYGLVKAGGGYSQASFNAAVATQTPGGGTPLADALLDTHATLVVPPFGGVPGDERRYLALFTDGILTAGAPLSSIANGSLANTAVFALGFGTGADVDYGTLTAMVAKGQPLATQQVFHGDNAGVIDKFYSQALAAAIGFAPIIDPVVELFEGEHTHIGFSATSAEEAFFITVQGMDFDDSAWSFQLIGPDGQVAYSDGAAPVHTHGGGHSMGRAPVATARRSRARLSMFVHRDSADDMAWVGNWQLLLAWRAATLDAMVMLNPGDLMIPVAAGPTRGRRYARLLLPPAKRVPTRAMRSRPRHRLDILPASTNLSDRPACNAVVNIYARTRLRVELHPDIGRGMAGAPFAVAVDAGALLGAIRDLNGFARLIAPLQDLRTFVRPNKLSATLKKQTRLQTKDRMAFDPALVLARLESKNTRLAQVRDIELPVVSHHGGAPHVHVAETKVAGAYNVGLWLEGTYDAGAVAQQHDGHQHQPQPGGGEHFLRVLSASVGLRSGRAAPAPRSRARPRARRRKT
jgi:hypothetical protein